MQNKYYVPSHEELFIGYECERYDMGEFATMVSGPAWALKHSWLNETDHSNAYKIEVNLNLFAELWSRMGEYVSLRTKKLDQADIESLGWVLSDRIASTDNRKLFYKLVTLDQGLPEGPEELRHNLTLLLDNEFPTIFINRDNGAGFGTQVFSGTCKSINELRTVLRLTGL